MLANIKYVFQIPLAWYRAVNAFCFNSFGGNLIQLTPQKNGSVAFEVDEEELKQLVPSNEVGNAPANGMDVNPAVYDTLGNELIWGSGGDNGVVIDCYCNAAPYVSGSSRTMLQRFRLTFSKSGLLVSAVRMKERTAIMARIENPS